ncbi:hypothetical protein, partial [Pseudomonas aeruginosa]
QALQQAGARYIVVWLLPDLGLTPATFGGPLQPFASQLSGTFNAELTAQLSQAEGSRVGHAFLEQQRDVQRNDVGAGLAQLG